MEKFPTNEFILSRIEELKLQGFDQVRIPGGSSKDESHYSGVFIFQYDQESKQVYFLGVPYNSNHWKDNGSNGHTKKLNETYKETGCREVFEETGYNLEESDLTLILECSVNDRKDKTKKHKKNFYACDVFTGNLHNFTGANLIDKETAAPIWIPVSIFMEVIYKGHSLALSKTVDYLKNSTLELYDALAKF